MSTIADSVMVVNFVGGPASTFLSGADGCADFSGVVAYYGYDDPRDWCGVMAMFPT